MKACLNTHYEQVFQVRCFIWSFHSGFGEVAGSVLTHHMNVNKITFTGSTSVGRLVLKASADSNFKRVTLEMGGKNPMIVFPDVDRKFLSLSFHYDLFCVLHSIS